jgi:hypothetical protein
MSCFLRISKIDDRRPARTIGLAAAAMAGLLAMTAPSFAKIVHLTAALTSAKEVPPNDTKGSGTLTATFNTKTMKLSWRLPYSSLTGPATAAHFHGPAQPGTNAPVEVPLTDVDKSPIKGSAVLTEAQAKDLLSGNMYVNIHTAANKGGEIRDQVAIRK